LEHDKFHPGPAAAGERERVAAAVGTSGAYALYVGAADARKNVPMMIRALSQSGIDVPLVLAGPISTAQQAAIEALADREGVRGLVRVLGYVNDDLVVPLYRHCHMHVFPSSYEGFGFPVIEAMACGAPTICSQASSLAEVAGDAALTMRLETQSLADAMRRLAEDETLRSELRRRGLERAREFTWERCARATLDVYEEVLS
jgi:glycosyltransferase involved in cell wall biosynthesis